MKLIVGLGNIGTDYARTRHNIGFMVIDQLAKDLQTDVWHLETKFKAEISRTSDILLAKPHTMMNLSGEAVQRIMRFYKIHPRDVYAIFDDVDIPFGRLRIRSNPGTSGGHQGANSLIKHIGPDFIRIRVGISLNDRSRESSEEYVLKPFNPIERQHLGALIHEASSIITSQIKQETPEDTTFNLID